MLTPSDFAGFFQEVHGYEPFPWQQRLLTQVAESEGRWPAMLDLPTGSGKTAAMDIALFHLALEADRATARRAPVRIAFVVDRRLVVDDAYERARTLAKALGDGHRGPVTTRVAEQLQKLSNDGPPVIARRLRGGVPREDDWARTPAQPTILCSTVDQVGSRLLFRGYGVSDSMKPVHAGLLGSDCLILLDEAHLAEPFRQTLGWVRCYREEKWRESRDAAPWGTALLTATPGVDARDAFALSDDDRAHPILRKRLEASKLARVIAPAKLRVPSEDADHTSDEEAESVVKDLSHRVTIVAREVRNAVDHFRNAKHGTAAPAIAVVVNRVARARAVFEQLKKDFEKEVSSGKFGEPILMIGPARPVDRDAVAEKLAPIHTRIWASGQHRALDKPLIIVATQCIEAGVDIDLDALVTELAPLDALRQRFGRVNRAGRDIVPYAAIVVMKSDVSAKYVDPVYEMALKPAWEALEEAQDGGKGVEFGLSAFAVRINDDALAPKSDAPVLLPAHLDLLSQTSPIPAADLDLALYLHGPNRQPDAVTVVWRADIDPDVHQSNEDTRRLLSLVPPRSTEAIELPVWAVRRWLRQRRGDTALNELADVAGRATDEDRPSADDEKRRVFRWKGDDERSRWIDPPLVRPGDTIVVPAVYGGVDQFGWDVPGPERREAAAGEGIKPVVDKAQQAARPFAGRRFAVRVAPGLIDGFVSNDALADALAGTPSRRWRDVRATVLELSLPDAIRNDLKSLNDAKGGKVVAYLDAYGHVDGRPRGVVFTAPWGIKAKAVEEEGTPNTTEDDASGSLPGFALKLSQHNQDVGRLAADYARTAGLPGARVKDLECSGYLHDLGKADPRFQAWLHYGDPLGPDPDNPDQLLAKSGRRLPPVARAESGLPEHWRHEARSVRWALAHPRFSEAKDPELVLWLIGAHHGHGRPLFPHCDPEEAAPNVGPQSLAFDWQGGDWPSLFTRVKARYGVWELARMEAILRLADHRASEKRAPETTAS